MEMVAMRGWSLQLRASLFVLLYVVAVAEVDAEGNGNGNGIEVENDILRFSYELERWLDTEKRPCEDFFGYVCGRNQSAAERHLAEYLQEQQEKFEKFLVSGDDKDDQLSDVELKLKNFFVSCKEARSIADLQASHLYRMSGGWPAIDDSVAAARKRRPTWLEVVASFHDVGAEYFFRYRVEIKSNKRIVRLEPDESKHYTLRKFEQLASEVMKEYAVDAGRARLVALETMSFERSRRDLVKQASEDDSAELRYADFKSTLFGSDLLLDWDSYFRKILGKPLKETDYVHVRQPLRLKQLFELLEKTTLTRLLNWLWIDYLMDKGPKECKSLVEEYFEPVYQHIVERFALNKMQMAQVYSNLGRSYDDLLATTPWIDEMTVQNSKRFLGRVIHLTLNGDAKLDEDYEGLIITKRNFYRNMEKCQRYRAQRRKVQSMLASTLPAATQPADFMKVFLTVNALLRGHNLTAPLSYVLIGERFAEYMIAGGATSSIPGAWRSMDSERVFLTLQHCVRWQQLENTTGFNGTVGPDGAYNINDLLLKMLAQSLTLDAYADWQRQQDATFVRRIDRLLAAGRLQLSLRRLYFIGSLLIDCQRYADPMQGRDFVHAYTRNSHEFMQAFSCHRGNAIYAQNVCNVL